MGTKQVNIRLHTSLLDQFEVMAEEHDRPRTYFMVKAMEQFLEGKSKKKSTPTKRFVPPGLDVVQGEFLTRCGSSEEAQAFIDFYESKNWMVGKTKMSNWKSAVAGWIRRKNEGGYKTAQDKRSQRNQQIFDYDRATQF